MTAPEQRPTRIPRCEAEAPSGSLWPTCSRPAGHDAHHETVSGYRWHTSQPTIVCLCGSTRFWDQLAEANLHETAAGRIVLAPGCDLKTPHPLWADPAQAHQLKQRLDALHRAKIDAADEILVVNPGGYIGDSTRAEIAYARTLGKPVRYTHDTSPQE